MPLRKGTFCLSEGKKLEIGRVLYLKSEITRSQIGRADHVARRSSLRSCNFGFKMRDSSVLQSPPGSH